MKQTIKKNTIMLIIEIIVLLCILAIILFNMFIYFTVLKRYPLDVSNLSIAHIKNEDPSIISYDLASKNLGVIIENEYVENNNIKVKVVGVYNYGNAGRTVYSTNLDENKNIEHIYLEDTMGNLKELWNKENGFLIDSI